MGLKLALYWRRGDGERDLDQERDRDRERDWEREPVLVETETELRDREGERLCATDSDRRVCRSTVSEPDSFGNSVMRFPTGVDGR